MFLLIFFRRNYQRVGIGVISFYVHCVGWVGLGWVGLGDTPCSGLNVVLCCHLPLLAN